MTRADRPSGLFEILTTAPVAGELHACTFRPSNLPGVLCSEALSPDDADSVSRYLRAQYPNHRHGWRDPVDGQGVIVNSDGSYQHLA